MGGGGAQRHRQQPRRRRVVDSSNRCWSPETGGDDTFNGSGGNDTMSGGTGNDWYGSAGSGDAVIENAGAGLRQGLLLDLSITRSPRSNSGPLVEAAARSTAPGNALAPTASRYLFCRHSLRNRRATTGCSATAETTPYGATPGIFWTAVPSTDMLYGSTGTERSGVSQTAAHTAEGVFHDHIHGFLLGRGRRVGLSRIDENRPSRATRRSPISARTHSLASPASSNMSAA